MVVHRTSANSENAAYCLETEADTRISLRRNITLTQIFYNRISAWMPTGYAGRIAAERTTLETSKHISLPEDQYIAGDTKFSIV